MSRTIEELRAIGERAEATLIRVYELYSMGDPPILTPGIVEAVLEAAEAAVLEAEAEAEAEPPYNPWQYNDPNNVRVVPLAAPQPQSKIVLAPSDDLESAVIARLRELATDGIMPTQRFFDARRGDLPNAALLYENWGRRHWAEWAELAGLAYAGPRNSGRRKARKTEAPTPEATFRSGEINGAAAPDYPVTHYIEADGSVHWSRD